jgi:hypothetical protein
MAFAAASAPLLGLAFALSASPASSLDFDLTRRTGEIALANWPDCNSLVIETENGFSLGMWVSGYWMWDESDRVYGPANQVGRQTVLVVGWVMSGEMTLDLEETGTDLKRAQKFYYSRCHPQTSSR